MVVKPGIQTTEFWATVIFDAAVLVAALADGLPARWAAIAGSISTALYSLSRGLAKQTAAILPVMPAQAQVAPLVPQPPAQAPSGPAGR